jgi:hypothetical protein
VLTASCTQALKVIALFLESIRRPREFARAAYRALAAGTPIAALKIGRSEHASHMALAHIDTIVVHGSARRTGGRSDMRVCHAEPLVVLTSAWTTPVRQTAAAPVPTQKYGRVL